MPNPAPFWHIHPLNLYQPESFPLRLKGDLNSFDHHAACSLARRRRSPRPRRCRGAQRLRPRLVRNPPLGRLLGLLGLVCRDHPGEGLRARGTAHGEVLLFLRKMVGAFGALLHAA